MPKNLIGAGIPTYPAGLKDTEVGLVLPLYQGLHNLAAQVSEATGQVEYSSAELLGLDRADGLKLQNFSRLAIVAGESLGFGDLLALSVSGGNIIAYKATNTDLTKPALACCNVPGGIPNGAAGQAIFLTGRTTGISGSGFGLTYYLGTGGAVALVPPSGDNVIRQIVGVGLGSAGFYLNIQPVGKDLFSVAKPSAAVLRAYFTDGSHTDHAV